MRLIDADAYIEEALSRIEPQDMYLPINIKEMILDKMPTVDAVPVIRCRDCKFLRFTGTVWKCQNRLVMMLCEPNDYCSRAERNGE